MSSERILDSGLTTTLCCNICGGEVDKILDLGLQWPTDPLWNSPVPPVPDRRHSLRLDCCRCCGLVQIVDPLPPADIYPDASLEMASWKNLPQTSWQIEMLRSHLPSEATVVETGSNDGHFLGALRDAGFSRLIGIEPSRASCALSRAKGLEVIEGFATVDLGTELVGKLGAADLVVAKHMFGHIPDLTGYFAFLDVLLKPGGMFFLEIPDFSQAFISADCSMIYEEIVNYFTADTVSFALERFGYQILTIEKFPNNGGLLEILAKRTAVSSQTDFPVIPPELETFEKRANEYARRLEECLKEQRRHGRKIFVYGGGMRSAALLNGFGLAKYVDLIIDDNPQKQGKFFPGCGLPIMTSESAAAIMGDKVFLLAVSNENESLVVAKIHNLFGSRALCASILGPDDRYAFIEKLMST